MPQLATSDLTGARVVETVARGKHLLTRIAGDEERTLHTHLKMEGSWRVYARGERWKRPAHQARVVLVTSTHQAVGFSLGIVELIPTSQEPDVVGHLGPDLLGPDWDEAEALRRLREDPARPLAEALLDQTRSRRHRQHVRLRAVLRRPACNPRTPIAEVPDLARLVRLAKQMLEQNVTRATQATTGNLREPFWVYRRDKAPCRRCGTPIEVAMRGEPGRERASYWCPRCQA